MIFNQYKVLVEKSHDFLEKRRFDSLFILILFFLNVCYLFFAINFHVIFQETDGFSYYLYFQDFRQNNIPSHSEFWPPGIPLLIGLVSEFFGDFFLAGKILMVEFTILFLLSIFLLIRKTFDSKVALLTTLFFATNPSMVIYFFEIWTDIAFSSMVLFSLYFVTRSDSELSYKNLFLSALFLGLACWIRWFGFFVFPTMVLSIILYNFRPRSEKQLISRKLFQKWMINGFCQD